MRSIPLMFILALAVTGNACAELYRSIDNSGNVHYSDRPLPGVEDVEELKVDKAPPPDESLPYESQRAQQHFPVVLYLTPSCVIACTQARELLNKRGVPFTEKNLVAQEDIDAFRKASGGSEVPALTVGRIWVKGFLAEQWHKELDFAGYPKSVPHRIKPATSSVPPVQ